MSSTNGARPVALITGASKGIGRATAELLVERGYRVLGTSRDPASVANPVDGVEYIQLELGDEASIRACAEAAGPVDVLVNNAGASQVGPIEEIPRESIEQLFRVNVFAQVQLAQLCLPAMRERGSGVVVFLGSMLAEFPVPFQSTYCATKLALQGYVQSLRGEVEPFGIRVALVQPGYFDTEIRNDRERVVSDDSPYAPRVTEFAELIDNNGAAGGDPADVARKVWKVISAHDPAPVLSVGSGGPALVFVKRFASRRRVERLIARRYGL